MKYISVLLFSLATFLAVPSFGDHIDEFPMPQEKYETLTDGAKAIIEENRIDCKDEYDGTFTVLNHAVTKLRVGRNDEYKQTLARVEVLNYGGLVCSNGGSWCGSGGCHHQLLVDGVGHSGGGTSQGFEEVQLKNGEYILVGGLHGSSCDTAGYNYCYVALRWDGERFLWKKP